MNCTNPDDEINRQQKQETLLWISVSKSVVILCISSKWYCWIEKRRKKIIIEYLWMSSEKKIKEPNWKFCANDCIVQFYIERKRSHITKTGMHFTMIRQFKFNVNRYNILLDFGLFYFYFVALPFIQFFRLYFSVFFFYLFSVRFAIHLPEVHRNIFL